MTLQHARFTRRDALALIAGALAGLSLPALAAAPDDPAAGSADADKPRWPPALLASFTAFCDILVPADDLGPAASALGVPARALAHGGDNPMFGKLVAISVGWLDQQAGGDFAAAAEVDREAILQAMAQLPWEAPQKRFFDLMRDLVMGFYWSQPATWKGLATDRPPQPAGYFEAVQ